MGHDYGAALDLTSLLPYFARYCILTACFRYWWTAYHQDAELIGMVEEEVSMPR